MGRVVKGRKADKLDVGLLVIYWLMELNGFLLQLHSEEVKVELDNGQEVAVHTGKAGHRCSRAHLLVVHS